MAKTNDFEHLPCPHCGKRGLKWDFAAGQPRCPHCHLSGFPAEGKTPAPEQAPTQKAEPKPITNKEIEHSARNSNLAQKVTETYERETPNGEIEYVKVERLVPVTPERDIPDLTINYKMALFVKHRLRGLISQEKRWGRDDLRKRGFRKTGRMLDTATGKVYPTIAKPGEEDQAGEGRYALGHAIAVVRRAEEKLRQAEQSGDNFPPSDD